MKIAYGYNRLHMAQRLLNQTKERYDFNFAINQVL